MKNSPSIGRKLWSVVLAAGEGTRLRPLTRALHGSDLPKQFATIQGGRSLLMATIERVQRWSAAERTVVVVAEEREDLARSQLPDPRLDLVPQPRNLGTGPGILLPLARILARDPHAVVVIVPSDHYVRDEEPFLDTIREAELLARAEDCVVLVGAVPEGAETQYGWIQTEQEEGARSQRVAGFREKPSLPVAERLLADGALWNTFIMVGPARKLWDLAREHLPEQCAAFDSYRAAVDTHEEPHVRSDIYERLEPADFSRDLLEKAEGLALVALSPCGWSDWGTPARVFRSLAGSSDAEELISRIRATSGYEKELMPLTGT